MAVVLQNEVASLVPELDTIAVERDERGLPGPQRGVDRGGSCVFVDEAPVGKRLRGGGEVGQHYDLAAHIRAARVDEGALDVHRGLGLRRRGSKNLAQSF